MNQLAAVKTFFIYVGAEDIYRCPAGERLTYRFTVEEHGKMLVTGRLLAAPVRSKLSARLAPNGVFRVGSTRLCWRRFSSGSTKTPTG